MSTPDKKRKMIALPIELYEKLKQIAVASNRKITGQIEEYLKYEQDTKKD